MKTSFFNQMILFAALFASIPALAGEKALNGGDMCEDRFKVVRDDIASWINKGGSAGLTLPKLITFTQYNTDMLTEIAKAGISCVDNEVTVDGAEKTCENFKDASGNPQIVCNSTRFMATSESDQYVLVHHEYAGLAGIEVNSGESSTYAVSNQISEYLEEQTVKKLAVKAPVGVQTQSPGSPFDSLKKKFDSGSLLRPEEATGWFSGRCFAVNNKSEAIAQLFFGENSNPNGPLDPETEFKFFIGEVNYRELPSNLYDVLSMEDIKYLEGPNGIEYVLGTLTAAKVENSSLVSFLPDYLQLDRARMNGGFIIVENFQRDPLSKPEDESAYQLEKVCYFFKQVHN